MITYQLTEDNTVIKNGNIFISLHDTPQYPNTNEYYLEYKKWCEDGGVPLPPTVNITELKVKLYNDLSFHYEEMMKIISSAYPASERESWSIQVEEARYILTNSDEPTPWIDATSTEREIDRVVLANRIIEKSLMYRVIHGKLTGVRQKIEDQIDSAGEDETALLAIDVKVGWPDLSTL